MPSSLYNLIAETAYWSRTTKKPIKEVAGPDELFRGFFENCKRVSSECDFFDKQRMDDSRKYGKH